jgi:hypothetical protein
MSSLRRQNANRRNACKSTGPKTPTGKLSMALNARSHGLSSQVIFEGEDLKSVEALAEAFVGDGVWNELIKKMARQAAKQQMMMCRVRDARRKAWELAKVSDKILKRGEMLGIDKFPPGLGIDRDMKSMIKFLKKVSPHLFEAPIETDAEREIVALESVSKQLKKLVRYERQAANARDRALRDLEFAKRDYLMMSQSG